MSGPIIVVGADELRALLAEVVGRGLEPLALRLRSPEMPRAPAPVSGLMTAKDVAAVVRLSVRELRRLVREGHFPAPVKLGTRSIRWRREPPVSG